MTLLIRAFIVCQPHVLSSSAFSFAFACDVFMYCCRSRAIIIVCVFFSISLLDLYCCP
jgi:hypothetical protein